MKDGFFLTRHLHEAGEGYFRHLLFTVKTGLLLVVCGLLVIIHGLLPFLFTDTASCLIEDLYAELKARKEACDKSRGI